MSEAQSTQTPTNSLCIVKIPDNASIYSVLDFESSKSWGLVEIQPGVIYQGSWVGNEFQNEVAAVNVYTKQLLCLYRVSDHQATELINVMDSYQGTCEIIDSSNIWEGTMYQGIPCGYGYIYSSSGETLYEGFRFHTNNICYGKLYESNQLVYNGMICNSFRHGLADFSESGKVNWIHDTDDIASKISIFPNVSTEIHSFITQLHIESHCCSSSSSFYISLFPNLKSIEIGEYCCTDLNSYGSCSIENMPCLETLRIGSHSFCLTNSLSLSNLPNLTKLDIASNSFENTSRFYFNHLSVLKVLSLDSRSIQNYQEFIINDLPKLVKITSIQTNTVRSYTISSTEKQQPKTILQDVPQLREIDRNCCFMINSTQFTIRNAPLLVINSQFLWFQKAKIIECSNCPSVCDLPQMNQQEQNYLYQQYLNNLKTLKSWVLPANCFSRFKFEDSISLSSIPIQFLSFDINCFSHFSSLQFNQFSLLETMCIGDHCFNRKKLGCCVLKNCNKLKTVRIGEQCFIAATQFIIETNSPKLEIEIGAKSFPSLQLFSIHGNHTDLSLKIGELACNGNHDTSNRIEFTNISTLLSCSLKAGVFEWFDNIQLNSSWILKRNNEIEEIRVTGRNVKFINPNAFLKECSRFVYDYNNDVSTDGLTIYDFLYFHVYFG